MSKGQDLIVKGVATEDNIPSGAQAPWLAISSLEFYCFLMKLANSTGTPESSETGDGDFQQRLASPHSGGDQEIVEG